MATDSAYATCDETYRQQRELLLAQAPQLGGLLPADPPAPPSIRPLSRSDINRLLRQPANNHASLCILVGWGDGSVVEAVVRDPIMAQKKLIWLLLKGEEAAFAASFRRPILDGLLRAGVRMCHLSSEADFANLPLLEFGGLEQIPQLAGCDIVDSHPLSPAAEGLRARELPRLHTALSDRPQAYGNDIMDSFTGLVHASLNASAILPAPTMGDIRDCYGDAPVISIAAGPSLGRRIAQLRELQDRCVLVACEAVLHGLLDAGIQPHFVTSLERVPAMERFTTRAGECRSILIAPGLLYPKTIAPFGERLVGFYAGDDLYDWLDPERSLRINSGSSSGVMSLMASEYLSRGPIYLVGHDLSRSATSSHWDGAAVAAGDWKSFNAKKQEVFLADYDERMIPGNDGGLVPSIVWWDRFRDEIRSRSFEIKRLTGRTVYNVNAHDRIAARIDSTEAAPLPDPASLPLLPAWRPPARDEARWRNWQRRAAKLPEDGDRFVEHLRGVRETIAQRRKMPMASWDIEDISRRISLSANISEGNRAAFTYFLRSSLYNSLAELHLRRRTPSRARYHWQSLNTQDYLCEALANAVVSIRPQLQAISDDLTR